MGKYIVVLLVLFGCSENVDSEKLSNSVWVMRYAKELDEVPYYDTLSFCNDTLVSYKISSLDDILSGSYALDQNIIIVDVKNVQQHLRWKLEKQDSVLLFKSAKIITDADILDVPDSTLKLYRFERIW